MDYVQTADPVLRDEYVIWVCPLCGGTDRQLAHGRCVDECRVDGVIPEMVPVTVVPV